MVASQQQLAEAAYIHQMFEKQAEARPNAIALVFAEETLTYGELNRRANQLAHHLRHLGVGPESLVGICVERSLEMVWGLLGILKAGGAYVPFDPAYPSERLSYMLEDSGVSLLLTQQRFAEATPLRSAKVLLLDADAAVLRQECEENPHCTISPDNAAYAIYTSGSTGQPKAAINTHRAITNRLLWMQDTYHLKEGDRVLQKTSFSFDVSVWEFFWPLMVGARLVLARPGGHRDSAYLSRLIVEQEITTLHFVPSMLRVFLEESASSTCHNLRRVICSGEALDLALQEKFFRSMGTVDLHNLYGPTEAAVDVTSWRCEADSGLGIVPIGRPISNIEICLLDEQMQAAPVGVTGELYIGGVGLARGYLKRPDLTAERFIPHPYSEEQGTRLYRTGDLARYLADGNIEYLGRVDQQVKVRGMRVELGEIEAVLNKHPAVLEALVLVKEYGPADRRLVAYVVPDQAHALVAKLPRLKKEDLVLSEPLYELPNGMMIAHRNKWETDFLYSEIFKSETYWSHEIKLDKGACVFDVGANIGLFTLFIGQRCPQATIYAFEPIPPLYHLLASNARLYGLDVKLFDCGLSSKVGSEKLTYYPDCSILSGCFADKQHEQSVMMSFLRNTHPAWANEAQSFPDELLNELVAGRLATKEFVCRLQTISAVIKEHDIDRIDLLKIDAEKSELEVLAGINEEDWSKVRQVIVEVHDLDGRLEQIKKLLVEHGFDLTVVQDSSFKDTGLYNIYAVDHRAVETGPLQPEKQSSAASNGKWSDPQRLTRALQNYLREQLPDYMAPAAIVSLAAMPLTANGKVDRKALPAPDFSWLTADYVAPRTQVEETLAAIWSEVLGQDLIGVHADFFSLGGHSLLATMVITRVRQTLKIELPQRLFFEAPTVAKLAQFVEETKQLGESATAKLAASEAATNLSELSTGERASLVMRLKKKPEEISPEQTIPRRKDSGPVPLSFAQQRLWFLEQLGESNYLVPATSRLIGRLDVKALEASLNEIVRRHEALRTTFTTIEGQPMQVIAPQLALTLSVQDLSRLPFDERALEARRLREEALRPFDLERGTLVRASLARLDENEHLLMLTMHHIVSDGWSLGVLFSELATLYEGFVVGQPASLPELPIQYADFAVWQRQWLSGKVLERQLTYWKEQLAGSPAVLELPTDRPRPAVQTNQGSFLTCEIGPELTEALKELSRREGVSLYMLLLAAFKTLLARYADQEQVVVGTPIANRNWIDIENLIGFFVNTLVLRTDLSGNPPFRELLMRIREVTLGAFAHQDVPFEKLVEELQPDRDTSRTPLFQVMFSLQNAPMPSLELSNVTMTLLQDENTSAQFDLTLDVTERPHGMECLLEYNTDIFEHSTAQRILTHFSNLLESIANNPQQRLRELPLLTEAERRKILVQWNDTARDYPRESCVHQLFEQQVERSPQAAALVFRDERITYAELNQRANQIAQYLRQVGVRPETRVGILLERSVEMPVALLAILKAGGAYVAFDPSYPPERLRYMIEDSDVSVLLTQKCLLAGLPESLARLICLDSEWASIAELSAQNVPSEAYAANLAYLVYTSGSTGRPKGILIEHRSLVNASYAFIHKHRMTESDRLLQFASLSFDVAAEEFFSAWLSGGCVVMRPEQVVGSYAEFATLLQREKVTVVNLPASFWLEWLTALADHGGKVPESLRLVIVGNEKTLEEMLQKWRRLMGDRVAWSNAYGPSETTITASNYEPSSNGWAREDKSTVPIGRPVMNVEMYVLDAAQQLVPVDVAGELYIGGAGVARGYHKQAAQTAERFIPHPYSGKVGERLYRTGDAARYRADGNVEFLGRVDEQVKIRGFRVEVGEVEAVLAQHASVRDSVVLAREDERGGHRLVAYVVGSNGELRTEELRTYLKQKLVEYMVPASFVMMEALPLTPNGKVDRRALPEAEGARPDTDEVYVEPRSAMERTIANIWQEVLKLEKVSVNDNFFGLGGHSLLLVRAHSKVSEVLRVKLSMMEMFKYPTVSALAEHLSEQRDSTTTPPQTRNQAGTRVEALNRQRQLRQRANQKQQVGRVNG